MVYLGFPPNLSLIPVGLFELTVVYFTAEEEEVTNTEPYSPCIFPHDGRFVQTDDGPSL